MKDFLIRVEFINQTVRIYDVKPLIRRSCRFQVFLSSPDLFFSVHTDPCGYGIVWNDALDLSCNELFEHGIRKELF